MTSASLRGYKNFKEGQQFEQIITQTCEYYRESRIAHIQKTPEPFRVTRRLVKGQFEGHFEKQAQPDFKGTMIGGRAIVFDAKCTTTGKLQVTALSETQRNDLITHRELGAWAGVLVCFRLENKFAIIPIETFLKAKEMNGHAYWSVEECERYKVDFLLKGRRYFIDFLGGILDA